MPDWAQSAMKIGTQIYAETKDFADFIRVYPGSSVVIFKSVFMPDWAQSAIKIGTQIYAETTDFADFCTGQDDGEMTIFTAKAQRSKEAEGSLFSLPLCSKSSTISLITTEKRGNPPAKAQRNSG